MLVGRLAGWLAGWQAGRLGGAVLLCGLLIHDGPAPCSVCSFSLQAPLQLTDSNPIELLRASLLAAQPKRTLSSTALHLLAQPELRQLPRPLPPSSALHRSLSWLQARTGIKTQHLAVACQMLVAYTVGECMWQRRAGRRQQGAWCGGTWVLLAAPC